MDEVNLGEIAESVDCYISSFENEGGRNYAVSTDVSRLTVTLSEKVPSGGIVRGHRIGEICLSLDCNDLTVKEIDNVPKGLMDYVASEIEKDYADRFDVHYVYYSSSEKNL